MSSVYESNALSIFTAQVATIYRKLNNIKVSATQGTSMPIQESIDGSFKEPNSLGVKSFTINNKK